MFQAWLVVAPSWNFYTVSTVFFHKFGWANIGVTHFMSYLYMSSPIEATVKLTNTNTEHTQVIGFILYSFSNFPIIYTVAPVCYCTVHLSNTISLGALKFYVVFQKVVSEPLKHFDCLDPQGNYWRSPFRTQKLLDHLQHDIVKVKSQRNRDIVTPTVCGISKHNLSQPIHNFSFWM